MNYERCFCGCGKRAEQLHHVIYRQAIRAASDRPSWQSLLADQRNLVPVTHLCHGRHHSGMRRYQLGMLPDSVFVFAAEVLGAGRAHGYLARYYEGSDSRLDALLDEERRAA